MKIGKGSMCAFALAAGSLLSIGCVSTHSVPVDNVPITVEKSGIYKVEHIHARYREGTLVVEGELRLTRGVILAPYTYFDVRIFNAEGQLLAEPSAKFDRREKRYPGDPQLEATFEAETQVPIAEVARIEVLFHKQNSR